MNEIISSIIKREGGDVETSLDPYITLGKCCEKLVKLSEIQDFKEYIDDEIYMTQVRINICLRTIGLEAGEVNFPQFDVKEYIDKNMDKYFELCETFLKVGSNKHCNHIIDRVGKSEYDRFYKLFGKYDSDDLLDYLNQVMQQ